MSLEFSDWLPSAPHNSKEVKIGLWWLGAGIILGYNWDTVKSFVSTSYTIISETVASIITPEDDVIPKERPTKFIVGVGVIVRDPINNTVMMGRRLNSLGEGLFAVPGGHVDAGETFLMAGVRELMEETGLKVYNEHFPLDNGAYIHPQTTQKAFEQYCNQLQYCYELNQVRNSNNNNNNNGTNTTTTNNNDDVSIINPQNAFLAAQSIEVYCPEENCQLIVRIVIVDRPYASVNTNGKQSLVGIEPKLMEPNKCEGWYWVKWDDVRKLSIYHHNIAQSKHFQQAPLDIQAMALSDNNNNNSDRNNNYQDKDAPPLYTSANNHNNTDNNMTNPTAPTDYELVHLDNEQQQQQQRCLTPLVPQFSQGCVLKHTDQLFGPMQALAVAGFDPFKAIPASTTTNTIQEME